MSLAVIEAPGGAGLQVMCPHCSRMHDKNEYPPKCKRCGTLMDNKAAQAAQDMASVPDQS